MTVNEVEARTGLDRGTIRYYEREGLIKPEREANGYRNYSQADVEKLEKVKLLRSLYFSLDDIKAMDRSGEDFAGRVRARIGSLSASEADIGDAKRVLEKMLSDSASYETLDTRLYMGELSARSLELAAHDEPDDARWRVEAPENAYIPPELDYEASPWRRFFARGFDELIYFLFFTVFLCNILHLAPDRSVGQRAGQTVFIAAMCLIFEPVMLSLFGTTPGKWILGIRVTDREGNKLKWKAAFKRTLEVLAVGEGFGISGIGLALNIWAYMKATKCLELFWENGSRLEQRGESKRRAAVYVFCAVGVTALCVVSMLLAGRPANMGKLTPEELSENYNGLRDYYEIWPEWELMPDGSWAEKKIEGRPTEVTVVINASKAVPDPLELTLEDGYVTGLRFLCSAEDCPVFTDVGDAYNQAKLLVLALVGADRKAVSPLTGILQIERAMKDAWDVEYDLEFGDWRAVFTVGTNGELRQDGTITSRDPVNWCTELVIEKN